MSLLDTPKPPEITGARTVRPLDEAAPKTVLDLARKPEPATQPAKKEPVAMNSKAASIRTLLRDTPEGMDYDQLSNHTGIARDRIAAHVAGLLTSGDAKKFMDGERVFFKFSGDPARVGDRRGDQQPTTKTAAPPTGQRVPPQDARTASAAAPKAEAPKAPPVVSPPVDGERSTPHSSSAKPSAASAPVQQTAGVQSPGSASAGTVSATASTTATPAAPADQKHREPFDLMTELALVAAAILATEVRAMDFTNGPALARALQNFERADRLREDAKGARA